ncbi:MAG: T9SS type A sorting domain-containing protein [Rhodothermales bacterium]
MSMPYGLDTPEPFGAYLDGAFPVSTPSGSTDVPQLLSETGAFADLTTLEPAAGFIPYALNQPFWSDGAEKYRWIAIPNDGTHDTPAEQITFSEEGLWAFPPGTVAVKHFELPLDHADPLKTKRLETRFNIIGDDGSIYGLTYKWNDEQTDAELLEGGLKESIAVRTAQGIEIRSWEYPDRDMCLTCHNNAAGKIIGPRTRQLNGDLYYTKTDRTANQLATLNHLGIFSEAIDENALPTYLTSATREASDQPNTSTLEHSALSYLDSNCGYCHRPGVLFTSLFDARLSIPLENSGIINGFAFNNLGIAGSAIVVPGDTSNSLIYQRMKSLETQVAMPPIAKGRVDTLGMQLIADWILSLGEPTANEEVTANTEQTALLGNYPNPFRKTTTLSFMMAKTEPVKITLYDVHGVVVKTLLNQSMQRGRHEIKIDAEGLASGAYYVHLSTAMKVDTRALMLRK